jgi:transcriptional regulator with XRE-family HTH domain
MEVMNDHHTPNTPFKTLGNHLKYLREQSQETISEVSGAVEIDEPVLERIEDGRIRPDEDILLLLISHFAMPDQEAVQLWELAGYDGAPQLVRNSEGAQEDVQKAIVMLLAIDARTLYTDGLDISCNNGGVTLNFTQSTGTPQANSISKLGMSYEQAERVSLALQHALLKAKYLKGPKRLPPSISPDEI